MKTVLLITARFDPTADLLLTELRRRDVPCVRWNTYEFPLESALTYRAANHGFAAEIVSDARMVDLDTVGSVWWQWDQPGGFRQISLTRSDALRKPKLSWRLPHW